MNPFAQFAYSDEPDKTLSKEIIPSFVPPSAHRKRSFQSMRDMSAQDTSRVQVVPDKSIISAGNDCPRDEFVLSGVQQMIIKSSKSSSMTNTSSKKRKKKVNKSNPQIMSNFWIELKSMTTNYPFAVMLTAVLGAQTRDVVTVGVMHQLAAGLGGDICPANICSKSFDQLESFIKRLNYCHKKTDRMIYLAKTFHGEPIPSTVHGLRTIPGVGPIISEIIMRVAFGVKTKDNDIDSYDINESGCDIDEDKVELG